MEEGEALPLYAIRTKCQALWRWLGRTLCAASLSFVYVGLARAEGVVSAASGFDPTRVIGGAILLLLTAALLYRRQLQKLSARTRKLQLSEERFRVIVEGTSVVAWEYDAGSNAFTYVSAPGERLLGFALSDWQQSGFWQARLHPEDREIALSFLRGLMVSGEEREMEGGFFNAVRLFFKAGTGSHIRAHSDNGLDPLFHGLGIELDSAEEIPVVGHGKRREAKLLGAGHEFIDLAGGVEKAVFGMTVEMDEVAVAHSKTVPRSTIHGPRSNNSWFLARGPWPFIYYLSLL